MIATAADIGHLDTVYEGRRAFHGELHDHAKTGGTSDGQCPLSLWRREMKELEMDFAAIVDHKQVLHMYHPNWEDGLFIGGTEMATTLHGCKAQLPQLHYMMLFEGPEPLEELFNEFPEFEYTGGHDGHATYCDWELGRFKELIAAVKAKGGFFVHPHPKSVMVSDDPLDYWFADETGIEVFCNDYNSDNTKHDYKLWLALLEAGKRVWATAGSDYHRAPYTNALTTIYAKERTNKEFLSYLRVGDMICGHAGIRMAIGDTRMGGKCSFEGQRLVFSVGDFHKSILRPGHKFRVDLRNEKGELFRHEVIPGETAYFACDTDPSCRFYRIEVVDDTQKLRIAIGNPIWNEALL